MSVAPRRSEARELATTAIAVGIAAVSIVTFSALSPAACGPARAPVSPSPPASGSPAAAPSTSQLALAASSAPAQPPPAASSAPEPAAIANPVSWRDPGPLGVSPDGNDIPRLPRFYSALAGLASHERDDHVRVLWFGDSHTQADIWTDAVREALQQRFGVGGPGFVHVGWNTYGYRHAGVDLGVGGRWGVEPKTLVSGDKVDDGVFGLGGVRLVPRGGDARATIHVSNEALPGRGRWDLAYRFVAPGGAFEVSVTGSGPKAFKADPATLGQIQHVVLETAGPGGELMVSGARQGVQLLGAVVERSDAPGVVLDTLGLNGARVRSALTYDQTTWEAEVARRHPDLAIIAYGTNESSDIKIDRDLMTKRVQELLGRIRAAAPQADCLVFGPIDRGGEKYGEAIEAINEAERAAATESGCAFWNGQRAMGGKGSMDKWATEDPPLASGERIHLYTRGYQKLGEMLAGDLLRGYDAGVGQSGAAE